MITQSEDDQRPDTRDRIPELLEGCCGNRRGMLLKWTRDAVGMDKRNAMEMDKWDAMEMDEGCCGN